MAEEEINLTFREAINELNQIVEALENDKTLELEDSLLKYERGVALLRYLRKNLDQAELKVEALMGELDPEDSAAVESGLSKA